VTSLAQSVTLAIHAVIGLALIAAATVLSWHGTIDPQSTVAIFGTVIGLVGGSAGTLALVGFQQPPPNTVQAQVSAPADDPEA
jgi:hypothetical protein